MANSLRPFIVLRSILFGFLFGILSVSFLYDFDKIWFFVSLIFFFSSGFLILNKKLIIERLILICLGIAGTLIAFLVFDSSFPNQESVAYQTGENHFIEGTIYDIGSSESRQKLTISDLVINQNEYQDRILIFTPGFPEFKYGDRIQFNCNLKSPEPFDGFDYDKYLASKNIYGLCFLYDAPRLIQSDQGNLIVGTLVQIRSRVINEGDKILGEPHASLLAGLLLGEQRFSEKWQEIFQRTGTTHIVAASGYNVAVVTFLAFSFLTMLGIKRRQAFLFLSFSIAGYVILAGADAAVVRAGIMGFVILLSRQLGRRASMLNIILLTATGMLVINPLYFRYDVGFQLSMLSTIGLIYLAPILDQKWKFIPEDFAIRESFTATVAATLASLPIIILNFKTFSIVSLFANLLILPFIPYIMAFGMAGIVTSMLIAKLGVIAIAPTWALLEIILFILESISALHFAIL